MPFLRRQDGQATVELVAVLPFVAVIVALVWQLAVAGRAYHAAGAAARAGARAAALDQPADAVARAALPARLRPEADVEVASDGEVTVQVEVPLVVGRRSLGSVGATARSIPQGGAR